jgi:hypothetical protein
MLIVSSQLLNRASNQRLPRLHHRLLPPSCRRDRRLPNGIQVRFRISLVLLHKPMGRRSWLFTRLRYNGRYLRWIDLHGCDILFLWQVDQKGNMALAICQEARALG